MSSIMTSDDASEESEFSSTLNASPESFVYKALKDEQIECIHRIVCHRRDVLTVLPMGLGKSAIYQLISKGPYSQRHIKNRRRTPCFLLAYKVERYLHQVLLLKLMYQSNRSFNIPPGQPPPGYLNFWNIFVQIPPLPRPKSRSNAPS